MIKSPLRVKSSKHKWFTLNLNMYRNAHYHILNNAKKQYKLDIDDQITNLDLTTPIHIIYTLYPKTNRLTDLGNVCSIHQKFFEDALVDKGILVDDNYYCIPSSEFIFGNVDKHNPRVDIEIRTINENNN